MIKRLGKFIAVVIAIIFLQGFSPNVEFTALPSADIKTISGKTVNLAGIENNGKPMIILAWEVICQPCINEFNNIASLYDQWQLETGVKIVAVSVDDNRSSSRVVPLVRSKGWKYEFYLDPSHSFRQAMNVLSCPQAFVINGRGEVVWQKSGYSPGDELVIFEAVKNAAANSDNLK